MTQLAPKEHQISGFILQLFSGLNKEKIRYCVLRNYEKLPKEVGNDIDIWVKNGQQKACQRVLTTTAKRTGWEVVNYLPRLPFKGEGSYFIVKRGDPNKCLHIDCWSSIYWRGTSYVDEEIISDCVVFHKKGFYVPSAGVEASISLLKNFLYHGRIQEKYKSRIIQYSNRDPHTFLKSIIKPFGEKTSKNILEAAKTGSWDRIVKQHRILRRILIRRAIAREPFLQTKQWIRYLHGKMRECLFPRGGIFLVLIGPDGSGKSTVSESILESQIRRFFQKRVYYHGHFSYLPELKKLFLFSENGNRKVCSSREIHATEPKPYGIFKSLIYPIYYGLNYFIGHGLISKARARGWLVIFDRYFYDYFVQKEFINCPSWLLSIIARFIPRPNITAYLRSSPETIYKRKPELDIEELKRQAAICEKLINQLPNGIILDTSCTPKETQYRLQESIIRSIKSNHVKFHGM